MPFQNTWKGARAGYFSRKEIPTRSAYFFHFIKYFVEKAPKGVLTGLLNHSAGREFNRRLSRLHKGNQVV